MFFWVYDSIWDYVVINLKLSFVYCNFMKWYCKNVGVIKFVCVFVICLIFVGCIGVILGDEIGK